MHVYDALLFRGNNRFHLNVRSMPAFHEIKNRNAAVAGWMQKKTRMISPERQVVEIHFTLDRIVPIGRCMHD